MKYTAPQQIQRAIMLSKKPDLEITPKNVDALWEQENEDWGLQDESEEYRCGGVESNVTPEYSRNYEAKSRAAKMDDGSWVGWTYWYGGGKHGNPEEIEWICDAYYLDCKENEKTIIERTFTKIP